MAFNLATFKTRSLTAVVFVIVMVAGVVMSPWSFFILFSIIHFGCWFEYQKLVLLIDLDYAHISVFHKFGIMIAGWCLMLYLAYGDVYGVESREIGQWLGLILLAGLIIEAFISKKKNFKYIGHSIFGLVYISLPLALFVNLPELMPDVQRLAVVGGWSEWVLPAFVIGCMWINDTMAYIVGSLIGKTPFSKISPKKTWEGTLGGIILCAAVAGYLMYMLTDRVFDFGLGIWIAIAAVAAIAGTAGDLLESKLKRLAMVKDSGQIMPGHGGFLDRFDSLLVAAPFVWLFIRLML
jgi:phosphatidate cytidylyltransferase